MLYDFEWLNPGKPFPPVAEADRITRYVQNNLLFQGEHFDPNTGRNLYEEAITRIMNTGYFNDCPVCYPILLNYQRLVSLKKADMVCGEEPEITGIDSRFNDMLTALRQEIGLDPKLYATVIDLSRYGDAVWRKYVDEKGKGTFTVWSPIDWYPIVTKDGTYRITHHVLAWQYNRGTEESPDWRLAVQIHPVEGGYFISREYTATAYHGFIGDLVYENTITQTGFKDCAVVHISNINTSGTIFGYDDYTPIDSILCEIMTRIAQISAILDKHSAPAMTGPATMLSYDPATGERYLKKDQFFAVSPGEPLPSYLTWNGQLDSAFKELDVLFKQLYVITEMGEAILGLSEGSGQAISGTAMRFKMAAPLITVRRLTNVLTYPVKQLLHSVTTVGRQEIPDNQISIKWNDGLPTDPREDAELAKLLTGAQQLMPVTDALEEFMHVTVAEAQRWRKQILQDQQEFNQEDSNRGGGIDTTAQVNARKKGSDTGVTSFHGENNKPLTQV